MLDPILEQARTPDGRQRFFPAGQHPATARLRLTLSRLAEFGMDTEPPARRLQVELAAFEAAHSEEKADYLYAARRRA